MLRKYRLELGDGLKVRIFGHLDFYAASGQFGLKMSSIDPRFTLGELAMQREDVVRRLVAVRSVRREPQAAVLSPAPLRVGVVTSLGSAAWADFSSELQRSGFGFRLRVVDVRVQGEAAVPMVTRPIRTLGRARDLDVVVVIRGGGAKTELADVRLRVDRDGHRHERRCPSSPVSGTRSTARSPTRSRTRALKTPTACAAALVERVGEFVAQAERAWR